MNVQIKSNSNMAPNVSVSVFKGFLSRAYKINCESFEIFKNIFFTEHLFIAPASVCSENLGKILVRNN